MDLEFATGLAEEYITQLTGGHGSQLKVLKESTIECEFGWVFFYGPADPSIAVAGNAPFILDRKDGSVHSTGTAYPVEQYVESYARVGRAYPFAVPEYVVIIEGWRRGILKISLTQLIRGATGKSLAEGKKSSDEVLSDKTVTLKFQTNAEAGAFCEQAQQLGAVAKCETHFR